MSSAVLVEPDQTTQTVVVDDAPPPKISWFKVAMPTVAFLGRRLLSSAIVLLGATFIVFMLLSYALDPMADLHQSTDPNLPALIEQRRQLLNLNTPPFIRYFQWLWMVITGNLGQGWNRFAATEVSSLLGSAIPVTLSLVFAASILAILFGVLVGIVSALRQYTRFDYGVTFMSFVLFSLPSFWVAVLLKTWGAIGFNDFLNDPVISWPLVIVLSLLLAGLWSAIIGGATKMRLIVFLVSLLVTFFILVSFTPSAMSPRDWLANPSWGIPVLVLGREWLYNPNFGIPGIIVIGLGIALALVGLTVGINRPRPGVNPDIEASALDSTSGVTESMGTDGVVHEAVDLDNLNGGTGFRGWIRANRALGAALTTVLLGALLYTPLQFAFECARQVCLTIPAFALGSRVFGPFAMYRWWTIFLLALIAVLVGLLIGWLWGGYDRRISMRVAALTALGMGIFTFVDRVMRTWQFYNTLPQINNRPISTIGSTTPGVASSPLVQNDFFIMQLDAFTHVLLPTLALVLISFASYTRYTRASMLEVMNQDYIRTARAKGLPERVVTVRHAFRNALIPLATIIPLDIAGLFGGAVITERIFGWSGMGTLFITAVEGVEINVVMGYFLVTGTLLVIGSIVVDLVYAVLDPRIRVNA